MGFAKEDEVDIAIQNATKTNTEEGTRIASELQKMKQMLITEAIKNISTATKYLKYKQKYDKLKNELL